MANKIDDNVEGTWGSDIISTGNGDDNVLGRPGDDRIDGGNGNDFLIGNRGKDIVTGGNGKDIVSGGADDDVLTGGNGKDIFYFFNAVSPGDDIITDFHNDQIDLSVFDTDFVTLAASFTDVDGNAVIQHTENGTITLLGISSADLSASDFIF
jgi:Ca2+-binding RTX toxin-like protein